MTVSKSKKYSLLLFVMLLWGMNVIATKKILVTSFYAGYDDSFFGFFYSRMYSIPHSWLFLKAVRLPKGKEWFYIFHRKLI
ncbi:hypothetical protein GCM10020331_021580 [Ectobacillus funiculus]